MDTVGEWINNGFTVDLFWYGVVNETATVVDASVVELSLTDVFLQLSVQSQTAWSWSGFSVYDMVQSQHSLPPLAYITIDLSCPAIIGGTPGYDTIFGCNHFAPIAASGMNATAHFAPLVTFGGPVVPVNNYVVDFAHKLLP